MWLPEPGPEGVTGCCRITLDERALRRYAVETIGAAT
jgi:hypothetical protein